MPGSTVSMILMNMLIAIVMDAYSEVKDGTKDRSEGLPKQEISSLGVMGMGALLAGSS